MLKKRIIPCLDIKNGEVVKGVNFVNLKRVGNPVEHAAFYDKNGADEICFLDITASHEGRSTILDVVNQVALQCFIPLTVGGGIRNIDDIRNLLLAGADKVAINSATIKNPNLVKQAAEKFGSQCIVVAIDAKRNKNGMFEIFTHGGRNATGIDAVEWAKRVQQLGAGEILLTSMDRDGTGDGFDIELTSAVRNATSIPIIASGGVGKIDDFIECAEVADALLAASVFHFGKFSIGEVKQAMSEAGISIRDMGLQN